MASGDIEHSELPDNLLHEPKGASTAAAGTTYIANGAGSGSFKKLPISSLDITVPSVAVVSLQSGTPTASLVDSGLSQTATGILTDVNAFVGIPQEITNMINKNASEIYRLYENQKTINTQLNNSINTLKDKINELISDLKSVGIIDD